MVILEMKITVLLACSEVRGVITFQSTYIWHWHPTKQMNGLRSNETPRPKYSWIGPPVETHEKLISKKTARAPTISRPPLESPWRRVSKYAMHICV